ncbi:atlastin-3-like isoform X2 [Haemaphysalis longicornis]
MASRRDTGRPVQIVRMEGGKGCSLDDNALKRILLDDNIKDLPVVVVSVAGIFRKGKSFLLNFFLQYMRSRGQGDWMVNNVPSEGFRWRGGSDTETLGIWIWDEVFVTNTGGKKVAVIFLDTQGTFDTKTTVNNCATIFALSMMTSSVQIYNLSQNIGEDHLQHLQLFTQYGKLAQQNTEKRPFQKLLFLVRDWQYGYERSYGFDGGNDLLEQRLKVSDELDPELQNLRHDIQSCFSEISCFLMPHPGKKVASGPRFEGCLSDIDDEFKEQLEVLVPFVLQPHNLVVKKISNSDVTCRQMLDYFVKFAEVFNGDDLPDAKSILELFSEDQPFLDARSLVMHHSEMRKSALQLFKRETKLGGLERSKAYEESLEKKIDEEFESICKGNEGDRIRAHEEKIMNDAYEKAKKIMDDAEAKCKIGGSVKGIIDTIASLTPFILGGAFGGTATVVRLASLLVPLVMMATTIFEKKKVFKRIARLMKELDANALKKMKEFLDRLEAWFKDAQKTTGKAGSGASDSSQDFANGEISVYKATTVRDILREISAALDEDEDDAQTDENAVTPLKKSHPQCKFEPY